MAYCNTCSDYLCEECLIAHKRLKAVRNHKMVTLAQGKALDVRPQSNKTYYCNIHPEEILKLYCKTCKSLACLICFLSQHNGHDIGSIDSKARKEVKKGVTDLMEETDSILKKFKDNMNYIIVVENEKLKSLNSLKAQVNEKVDKLFKQLETRRDELLKEIDDTFAKDLKASGQTKSFTRQPLLTCKVHYPLLNDH